MSIHDEPWGDGPKPDNNSSLFIGLAFLAVIAGAIVSGFIW